MITDNTKVDRRLIIAIDTTNVEQILGIIKDTREYCSIYKFGAVAFANGFVSSQLPQWCRDLDFDVMIDNKYYDIPNTVLMAIRNLLAANHRVKFITVHTKGGVVMINAARKEADILPDVKILAITELTSLNEEHLIAIGYPRGTDMGQLVFMLASYAFKSGADGIVCSPAELSQLGSLKIPGRIFVTPGIQLAGVNADQNQQRIATPYTALKNGADYIVVGREITAAPNRRDAIMRVIANMRGE